MWREPCRIVPLVCPATTTIFAQLRPSGREMAPSKRSKTGNMPSVARKRVADSDGELQSDASSELTQQRPSE